MAGNFGGLINSLSVPVQGGSVTSGTIGPGTVTSGIPSSGAVTGQAGGGFFVIASGTVGSNDIGSGAIVSGRVASGQIGTGHLADGAVTSGDIASGQVDTYHMASGVTVARAQFVAPLFSGTLWKLLTEEAVSGVKAVALSQSGGLLMAMAAVSGRMPAVGVVVDNVLSGIQANVYTQGLLQFTSGLFTGIGHFGQPVWVGRSGQVVTISGSWGSGGFLSGDLGQKLGVAVGGLSSGGVLLNVDADVSSGGPLGQGQGGVV